MNNSTNAATWKAIATMAAAIVCAGSGAAAPAMERVHPRVTVLEVTTAPGSQPYSHWRPWHRARVHGQLNLAALDEQAQA